MEQDSIMLAKKALVSDFNHTEHIYIDICGDLVTGTLLSQILYWFKPTHDGKYKTRVFHDGEFWLAKNREDWWNEIRITPRQFDYAIKSLIKKGFIEKRLFKFNGIPTVHVRPIAENINKATDEWVQNYALSLEKEPTNNENSPILTNCQNGFLQNVKMDFDKSVKSITETTNRDYTETTKESRTTKRSSNTSVASPTSNFDEQPEYVDILNISQTEVTLKSICEKLSLSNEIDLAKIKAFYRYYAEGYKYSQGVGKQEINVETLEKYTNRLASFKLINGGTGSMLEFTTDEIQWMIDDYFEFPFDNCDYSIHHLMNRRILSTRYRRLKNKTIGVAM